MQQHEAVLDIQLKELKLSTFKNNWHEIEQLAISKNYSYSQYLSHLCGIEIDKRISTRLARMIKESKLPKNKILSSYDFNVTKWRIQLDNATSIRL